MSDSTLRWMIGAFCVLVGAAGWFYMFYSTAAHKLAGVENPSVNRRRIRLRRVCGAMMVALAAVFYVGCDALLRREITLFMLMLVALLALMAGILTLGLIDLRLTQRLRKDKSNRDE